MIISIDYLIHGLSILGFLYLLCKYIGNKSENSFYKEIVKSKSVIVYNSENKNTFNEEFEKRNSIFNVAGFDCEWVQNEKVSLMQIAFPDGCCFILRMFNSASEIPIIVQNWCNDKHKLKFGVGISEDSMKLATDWQLIIRGCVDLRHLAVRLRENDMDKMGLKNFAASWLSVQYGKLTNQQCSDWLKEDLSNDQLEYAVLDALVGALCPVEFLHRKLGLLRSEVIKNSEAVRKFCQGCVDVKFKRIKKANNVMKAKNKANYQVKVGPMYDNNILETQDGEMLSRLSRKKAEWYIYKGLGKLVCEDPFTVRLTFEPSGRASGKDDYYVQAKENQCVVCGESDSGCVKKNIVPVEYKRHYPVSFKSKKSHDVLPLCVKCHQISNIMDDARKKEIAQQYNAPLGSRHASSTKADYRMNRIRNAANALLNVPNIPEARKVELRKIIMEELNVVKDDADDQIGLSQYELQEIFDKSNRRGGAMGSKQHGNHGKQVVDSLSQPEGLVNFEVSWRQHFIDKLQPQFLPRGWEVSHRADRFLAMKNDSAVPIMTVINEQNETNGNIEVKISENDDSFKSLVDVEE